jgi:Domain of unknown function (DUF4190)
MTLPPPPPPGDRPNYGAPPPIGAPPPGYAPYGQLPYAAQPGQFGQPAKSGMAIAGLVLSLVGVIPCFWFWFLQVPGYLGVIFSIIGLKATKGGARRGRGMAIAGLVVGLAVVAMALLITLVVYTSNDCITDGIQFECQF